MLAQFKQDLYENNVEEYKHFCAVFREFFGQDLFKKQHSTFQINLWELIREVAPQNWTFDHVSEIYGKHVRKEKDFAIMIFDVVKNVPVEL